MADESIVIEVKDGVASSISTKLKSIATEARAGHSAVETLQKQLNSLSGKGLQAILQSTNSAASAISKVTLAQQNLATAEQKTTAATHLAAAAQSRAAAEAARAATEAAKLAAAQARVQTATDQAAAAALRLEAAQARATARTQASALAAANAATEAAKLATATGKTTAATDKYVMSARAQAAAMRGVPAQITDIVVSLQGGQAPLTVLLQQGGQLKDMFGGIGPALKALAAGVIALITPLSVVLVAFAAFAAAVALVESRMRELNGLIAQFSATGRGNIDGTFIVELRKELQLLPGVSRTAATEIIAAFATVRNVGGENLKAATKLVADLAVAMGTDTKAAAEKMAKALDDPLKGAIELDKQLGFLTVQNFKTIDSLTKVGKTAEAQKLLIDLLKRSIGGLADEAMSPLQRATNDLKNAWNKFTGELSNSGPIKAATDLLISLINALTAMLNKLTELQSWKPPAWVTWMEENGPNSWVKSIFGGGKTNTGGATGSWGDSAIVGNANIKARIGSGQTTESKLKAAGINQPKGRKDNSEENRATALAKINAQLDNQIKLMGMLGPQREKQEMFDRIEEGLLSRKIKLTEQETATIKEKIQAIVGAAAHQQEFNRIYEDSIEPLRTYNAIQSATNDLLERGAISQVQADRELTKAFENYSNIIDPLREFNKELDEQLELSKLTTEQAQIESQVMALNAQLLTKGITLRGDELKIIRERLRAVQESIAVQSAENAVLDQTVNKRKEQLRVMDAIAKLSASGAITAGDKATQTSSIIQGLGLSTEGLKVGADAHVEVFRNMYAEIANLQQKNLIDEQDASNLRMQVWAKEQEYKLAGVSQLFGHLASLSSSSNKKLAAIGKAAAITQATINTFVAATKALAEGGPYLGPALAAAITAAGLAQVANIASQGTTGFMNGGYTGDIPTNQIAGAVHGQEFVMNSASTQRIGAANLQALQNGSAAVVANSTGATAPGAGNNGATGRAGASASQTNVQVPIRMVNVLDPAMMGDYLATPEGEQLFVNTIRRNSDSVRQAISNG